MAKRLHNDFQFLDVARVDPSKKDINTRTHEFVENLLSIRARPGD